MKIVTDTSAILAILDDRDPDHAAAVTCLRQLGTQHDELLFTNYAVTETLSLVTRRLGMAAAADAQRIVASGSILWTTRLEHAAAVATFLGTGHSLSIVDCATFATMRNRKLTKAFAFDADFARAGFELVNS